MTFDELQNKWESQGNFKLNIDSSVLLNQVKRNKQDFESTIFWRDFREVGVSFLLVFVFLYFALKSMLWPLWLLAFLCFFVGAFMIVDRIIQRKKQPKFSENLKGCIENSIWQVNHQIWLLKNVLWWALVPLGTGLIVWFSYCAILILRSEISSVKNLTLSLINIVGTILLFWGSYWLNRLAIRKELDPRKYELQELLENLQNSTDFQPDANP